MDLSWWYMVQIMIPIYSSKFSKKINLFIKRKKKWIKWSIQYYISGRVVVEPQTILQTFYKILLQLLLKNKISY